MINNLKSISDGNVQTIDNEEQIADKKLAIEVWERDIYQKKRVNMDVQVEIQNVLYEIDAKEKLIAERELRIQELRQELEDAKRQKKEFEDESAECDERIATLEHQLNNLESEKAKLIAEELERRRLEEEARKNQPKPPKGKYSAAKGDRVDELMAQYINQFELDVPLQRIGDGQYMFGSRKIFAKIMNDKLVVRVGGGYMRIDEFLATYGQQELDKLQAQLANNPGASFQAMQSPNRKSSAAMWSKTGRQSPPRGSPTAGAAGRGSPNAN